MVTGAPTVHGDMLLVPVASLEEAAAMRPGYACCTFRGDIVALDAQTGKRLWQSFTSRHRTGRHAQERARRATLRPVGRIGLVVTDGRSGQAPGLCDHRQQLLRPALGWRQRLRRLQAR